MRAKNPKFKFAVRSISCGSLSLAVALEALLPELISRSMKCVCVSCSPNHWCNHDLKVALLVDVWEEVVSEYMKEHSCSEDVARSNAKAVWLLDWCVSVCVRLCESVFYSTSESYRE